ncbi:MAG: TonB-dependent receptor [Pseudomonadota bacterium]
MFCRTAFLASNCIFTLVWSAPLAAEDADRQTIALDPIIVTTARREEEALLETPVAVTTVDGAEIGPAAVDTLQRAVERAPNTLFNDQGGPISIRGVTSAGISGGVDRQPAVGLFLDGVYIARPQGYPTFLEDIERVEIVRGSQSTLYGKNTIGGAINLLTRDPGPEPGGEFVIGGTDEPGYNARLSYQSPVSEDFALRGTVSKRYADGYIDNSATGNSVGDTDYLAAQAVLQGTLATGTRLRLSADYTRDDSDGGLWFAPVDEALDFEAEHDLDPDQELRIGGVALRLDHDFGAVALTSITAWRGHDLDFFLDGDFTASPDLIQGQTERQRQFSQEFRLSSTGDRTVDWRLGAYYLYEDFEAAQFFDFASIPRDLLSRSTFDQINYSVAVYGLADWQVAPDWTVSGGLRYTYDRKSTESEISSPSGTFFFGAPGAVDEDVSFQDVSPELTVSWQPGAQALVYAKLASGFKSGGISPYIEADGSANEYDPEKTDSAEIGYRYGSPDGRFSLSANAFYIRWRDQQVTIFTTPVTRVYRNAARSHSKGAELEVTAELAEGITLTGGYGYTDAQFDEFVDPILGADFSGNPLPFAPKNSLFLGLRWERPLSNRRTLRAALDYTYRGSYSFTPDNLFRQGETNIVDARISIEGEGWKATLFGKNLTDERYLTNYFAFFGEDTGVAAPGRTIGGELSMTF